MTSQYIIITLMHNSNLIQRFGHLPSSGMLHVGTNYIFVEIKSVSRKHQTNTTQQLLKTYNAL